MAVLLVVSGACAGESTPSHSGSTNVVRSSASPDPTRSTADANDPSVSAAGGSGRIQPLGIGAVEMAAATAPDGSAQSPGTTFDGARVRKIVAVLSLDNLGPGTTISYVRYLGAKYVNSKSAILKKRAKYFYFVFSALRGKTFTTGRYRLRLYVNQRPAWEVSYAVL